MKDTTTARLLMCTLTLGLAYITGCGGGDTSGTQGTGGMGATGGASGATGGNRGTGGTGTGGTIGTGGAVGTGGLSGSGGQGPVGSGGTPAGTGGRPGTGGAAVGAGGGAGGQPDGGVPMGTGGSSGADAGTSGSLAFNPPRGSISGGRDVTGPATQTLQLRNQGTSPVQVTALTFSGMHQTLFRVTAPAQLPATIAAGANLAVTLQVETSTGLPAAPTDAQARITGATLLTASLSATTSAGSLEIPVFGLIVRTLISPMLEPTFGQILTVLGYPMNVGRAQNNWNWNTNSTPATLGGVEAGTDEVAAQLFVKAGTGNVTMVPIARFSPEGEEDFGWYRPGMSSARTVVGQMAPANNSPQTSNGARMVYPPITGATTFDPGTTAFGVWASTSSGNDALHGVLNFSQDSLNTPANTHRVKAFTLKTAAGPVPNSYMLGFEEATNGDYQDYVFILTNVRPSP